MMRFFLLLFLLGASEAGAHSKSLSFGDWLWQGDSLELRFSVPARDVTLLPQVQSNTLAGALTAHLDSRISVAGCERVQGFETRPSTKAYLAAYARFLCTGEQIVISNHAFFNLASSHVHFARLREADKLENKEKNKEVLFTATARKFTFMRGEAEAQDTNIFSNYLRLGVEHILSGLDHIAFLFCLLLLAGLSRRVVWLVTGFTIGHSITLGAIALGLISVNGVVIESIIALSIALVAAEVILARARMMARVGFVAALLCFAFAISASGNLPVGAWAGLGVFLLCYGFLIRAPDDAHRLAPLLTLLFGLFHGAGFGGALQEIGLPQGQLIGALLGFNLGVEAGQIAIILGVAVLAWLARQARIHLRPHHLDVAACALTAYGAFLFFERSFF